MSNFGGKYSLFEKDFNQRFKSLNDSLERIENNILKILTSTIEDPKITSKYWRAINREINEQYKYMVRVFDNWAEKEIPLRYRRSIRNMSKRINATKSIANTARLNTIELIHTRGSAQIMGLLYQNALNDFAMAAVKGRKEIAKFTRLTQQKLIRDSLIDLDLSTVFMETGNLGKAIEGVSARLWNEAAEGLGNKRYVKTGIGKKARHYTPSYYAEMVGRVKFHEAHSEAGLMQAKNYDTDLIQVSSHNTKTAICLDFEGKVFSISGRDKRFPLLTETPPFHVNCLHLISPTFEGAMEVQGTLDSFSAFSKNEISRPPLPASFIPIDERTVA